MIEKLKQVFGKTDDVFRRYPMVLLMAFLAALSLICFAENDFNSHSEYFTFIRFAIVSMLGISLMFAINMLSQREGKTLIWQLLGVAFLVFFYFLLPDKEQDFTEKYAYLLIPTFILSHVLVSFIAFFGEKREINFWQYNKNLFINIFLSTVFTGVLTGGVMLAILAVDKLFNFNFSDRIYAQTFYFLAIFGSCFIFLLFNEKGLSHLEKDDTYPIVLKFFTQYILIPLLIIYAVILYFYSAKILINWELPRGWVSLLVLAYSVVGILALLLVHPLKAGAAKTWVKAFSKIFYYTLIPMLVLLYVAIFTRILEYGYTEPRYFVLILALWMTSVVAYFVFSPKTTIKFIPVSLFAFGVFALTFPYLNAFAVAKRSQKTELVKVLSENNLLENGKISFNKKVTDKVADDVADKFRFLNERNEEQFLLGYLKTEDQPLINNKNAVYTSQWNLRRRFKNVENTNTYNGSQQLIAKNKIINVDDYDFVVPINALYVQEGVSIGSDTIKAEQDTGKSGLTFRLSNKEEITVYADFTELFYQHQNSFGPIPVQDLSKEFDLGNYHFKIVFDEVTKVTQPVQNSYFGNATVLIRKK